jgi:hypothetical protein
MFSNEMPSNLLWAERVLSKDGRLYMVRCRTYTNMDTQENILAQKLDTFMKYEGQKRARKDMAAKDVKFMC